MFEVDRPAVVLGSTQRADVVDERACAAAGIEIVRRRSGGGAVLLEPGAVVWFDVIVPADVLRDAGVGDDVGASMVWIGDHIAGALDELGIGGVAVHRGAMACSSWCPLVCFAGLGPGEVVRDGRKLVGISQRRTRAGSRFQCAVHERWSPARLVAAARRRRATRRSRRRWPRCRCRWPRPSRVPSPPPSPADALTPGAIRVRAAGPSRAWRSGGRKHSDRDGGRAGARDGGQWGRWLTVGGYGGQSGGRWGRSRVPNEAAGRDLGSRKGVVRRDVRRRSRTSARRQGSPRPSVGVPGAARRLLLPRVRR